MTEPALGDRSADEAALRALAEAAARAGGVAARALFRTSVTVSTKSDGSEVSDADHAAQHAVVALIRRTRPADALLAEESLAEPAAATPRGSVCWVIDPIDGTRNFVRGIPLFCCSVGVLVAGVPRAGAIYDPIRDELFGGSIGGGAFLNGRPLRTPPDHRRPHLVAVPSKFRDDAGLLDSLPRDAVLRTLGSTALHLAMVAAGQLELALSNDSKLWDIAAGACLVEAAGGRISAPDGAPLFPLDPSTYDGREIPTRAGSPAYCHSIVAGGLLETS